MIVYVVIVDNSHKDSLTLHATRAAADAECERLLADFAKYLSFHKFADRTVPQNGPVVRLLMPDGEDVPEIRVEEHALVLAEMTAKGD